MVKKVFLTIFELPKKIDNKRVVVFKFKRKLLTITILSQKLNQIFIYTKKTDLHLKVLHE